MGKKDVTTATPQDGLTVKALAEQFNNHKAETADTIAKLQKDNKALAAELKKVTKGDAAKTEEAPKKKEPLVTPKQAVEYTGKEKELAGQYVFTGPKLMHENKPLLTAVITESPKEYASLINHLVEKKSGLLRKKA
jgi:hypothetical protein